MSNTCAVTGNIPKHKLIRKIKRYGGKICLTDPSATCNNFPVYVDTGWVWLMFNTDKTLWGFTVYRRNDPTGFGNLLEHCFKCEIIDEYNYDHPKFGDYFMTLELTEELFQSFNERPQNEIDTDSNTET